MFEMEIAIMGIEDRPWVVMKFGGTSVASVEGWRTIDAACGRILAQGARALVVCSAVAGVSNRLEALIETAVAGRDPEPEVRALCDVHSALAAELEIPLPVEVTRAIGELRLALEGIRLLREASPRVVARILALGERMSTRLGSAWLLQEGVDVAWADARELLQSTPNPDAPDAQNFLSAEVVASPDLALGRGLPRAAVILTQGFIASDPLGYTVLLGRGGSDTSATYLAVLLSAERVEIWTDVRGLFTANPKRVEAARHLERLGYDEAAAMASLGARVLHPRCVGPACGAGVPIHVRCTYEPQAAGTVIAVRDASSRIRAVTGRKGLALLKMCRPSQWQPVGFVADVSACFKRRGLSIDLMSTSPSTIVVTVDPASAPRTSLDALILDLEGVCEVVLEHPVASVSLVGTGVRETFDGIGGVLQHMQGVHVSMVAQGAADHHLTFVVDEASADGLIEALHCELFEDPPVQLQRVEEAAEMRA